MAQTPNTKYPYPAATDAPDGPGGFYALAMALDTPGWANYTPTFNITLGTSSFNVCEYQLYGDHVRIHGYIQLGGGFSISGGITMSLPVPARSATYPIGKYVAQQAGTNNMVPMEGDLAGTSTFRFYAPAVSGSIILLVNPSTTYPFTWAQTDKLAYDFEYVAARS